MENTNEKIKITSSEISEIIKEHKTKTNKELLKRDKIISDLKAKLSSKDDIIKKL
jgi:hypothetical protein